MTETTEKKLLVLIQTVFKTEKGQELINLLEEIKCNRPLFSSDALVMGYNTAQSDLIKELKQYLILTEDDLTPKNSPNHSAWD